MVSLPAGLLIFMSTITFSALLRSRGLASNWLELLLLAVNSAIVGLLVRVSRKKQAIPTALASGVMGALTILLMWIYSPQNAALNPLLFGVPGMAVACGMCVLAASVVPAR